MIKKKPILSIVVPTKNRYEYLLVLLEKLISYNSVDFEVIVEDNSTINEVFLEWQKDNSSDIIKYNYNGNHLSVIENCNNAFKRVNGEYICFIGDDDGISIYLIDFVKWLKVKGYEAASLDKAVYLWPDFKSKYLGNNKSGVLTFDNSTTYTYHEPQVDKELRKLLNCAAQSFCEMPKSYHAIVSKKSLDKLYAKSSSYFPGPVPDMTVTVGLAPFIKKYIYTNIPLIISGNTPKSTAGMGAEKKHLGKIENQSFLPNDTANLWDKEVPPFWSGPTIWAEGALKSLEATGQNNKRNLFNFPYLYASCLVFTSGFNSFTLKSMKENLSYYGYIKVLYYLFFLNIKRIKPFLSNYLGIKNKAIESVNGIENIRVCQEYLDNVLKEKPKFWEENT